MAQFSQRYWEMISLGYMESAHGILVITPLGVGRALEVDASQLFVFCVSICFTFVGKMPFGSDQIAQNVALSTTKRRPRQFEHFLSLNTLFYPISAVSLLRA
jgi:hypothetical protein